MKDRAYGPMIASWLDELAGSESMRAFCLRHGIDNARVSQWRKGITPSMEQLVALARATATPLPVVLVRGGYCTREDFGLSGVVIEREVRVERVQLSVEDAITADRDLDAGQRRWLLDCIAIARSARTGTLRARKSRLK